MNSIASTIVRKRSPMVFNNNKKNTHTMSFIGEDELCLIGSLELSSYYLPLNESQCDSVTYMWNGVLCIKLRSNKQPVILPN